MKKKLVAMLLCAAVACSVCACGETNSNENGNNNTENTQNSEVNENTENTENNQAAIELSVTQMADLSDLNAVLSGDYEITQTAIDAYLSDVLANAGIALTEVTDRDVVQAGDVVVIDYTGYLNDEAFSGGSATDQWIDVSNNCSVDETGAAGNGYIDGFSDGIIGAKVGETVSSEVTFPESYSNEDLAGQLTTFEFNVKAIYAKVTADTLSDDMVASNFSKGYGVDNVADFIAKVESELAYNYIINYAIDNSTFEIPESYINARVESYQNYFQELYLGDTTVEEYVTSLGATLEDAQLQWAASLQNQVKAEMILAEIVKNNEIVLDEAEHEAYIQSVMDVNGDVFPDAESIYKRVGAGDAEAGKAYLMNQNAVRDYMTEKYNEVAAQ